MPSRCWVADNAFARTQCGRKMTRAIGAVQMSAGDKDRPGFHRFGGSLTQADHVTQPASTNSARPIC